MFHTVLLIFMGLALVGVVSAILEQLFAQAIGAGLTDAVNIRLGLPIYMWSRILAAGVVLIAALTHTWTWLLIAIGLAFLYLISRKATP